MRDRKYENWFLSYQIDNEAGAAGATLAAFLGFTLFMGPSS